MRASTRPLAVVLLALAVACATKDEGGDGGRPPLSDDTAADTSGADGGADTDTGELDTVTGTGDLGADDGGLDSGLETFACGELICLSIYEYCYIAHSGREGKNNEYRCELTPEVCLPAPDCACLVSTGKVETPVETCSQDADGNLFVELYLP